jgi:hypothetical protein
MELCAKILPIGSETAMQSTTTTVRGGRVSEARPVLLSHASSSRRSLADVLVPLDQLAAQSSSLIANHGALLTEHLIEPALQAAEQFFPRNRDAIIDGFPAQDGIIRDSFPDVLSGPPVARPRPFEIILETPQSPSSFVKEAAFVMALQTILTEYRQFIAYAPNL